MRKYKPILYGTIICGGLLALTVVIVYNRYNSFKEVEQKALYNEALNAKNRLENCLYHAIAPAQTLKFIIEYYGVPYDFDEVAATLMKNNNCASSIQLVEKGVITKVYPMKGNEVVIGYNIFKDSLRNREAAKAITSENLYFAGPLSLKQGGIGIIGRVPYFLNSRFAGFAAVIIKMDTLIKTAQLSNTEKSNYNYQLSKINLNTGQKEYFIGKKSENNGSATVSIHLPMGEWILEVEAKKSVRLFHFIYTIIMGTVLSLSGGILTVYLLYLPKKLELKVAERTEQIRKHEVLLTRNLSEIEDQNRKLKEIAWIQSHKFRAPLARILGLLNVYKMTDDDDDRENLIANVEKSALELDHVIHEITRHSEEVKENHKE
ncbi:MAG: multi-sensor signal transduction histidine kinase [Bacteroidetes bacterium]|nr:multi-sensor signal transduction histidine kinase [Bacteroidota bacterium]